MIILTGYVLAKIQMVTKHGVSAPMTEVCYVLAKIQMVTKLIIVIP